MFLLCFSCWLCKPENLTPDDGSVANQFCCSVRKNVLVCMLGSVFLPFQNTILVANYLPTFTDDESFDSRTCKF